MGRIAFLFRTDTHTCDRSPISWKGDYPGEIWSNLRQIGQIAKDNEVRGVLDGGDFFHVKAASRNPHFIVRETSAIHKEYGCPVFSVEGNHDIQYNNLDTVEKQPIGVLYAAGIFQHLREEVFEDGVLRVRVVGVPYSPVRTLDELRAITKKPGDTHLIVVIHQLAGKNPPAHVEEFFRDPVFRYEDLITPNGPDVFCFGHWHRDQGIETINGRIFVNQGAVSRGALIGENLTRTPKVSVIEITDSGVTAKQVELSVAPAEDVFDLEAKAAQETERRDIDQFIAKLTTDASFMTNDDIQASISSLNFAHQVRDLALGYLDRVRSGRTKNG
jgi:DNA repair exonuclease SbcCD nuclease subunit